jgi:hypothetical protein
MFRAGGVWRRTPVSGGDVGFDFRAPDWLTAP